MCQLLSKNQQAISAARNPQLFALNSCERFECRTSGTATIRAVTIKRIAELIFYFIMDRAA
jgi:hypothetical protein